MKKIFALSLSLIFCAFLFAGCSTNQIDNLSKSLNTYNMDLVLDVEEYTLTGSEELIYTNRTDVVLSELCFHLYPNAFKDEDQTTKPVSLYNKAKAYPNGFDSGYIEIKDVEVNSSSVNYAIGGVENGILIVPLIDPVYPDESVAVDIELFVKIPNISHRFGYGGDTINLGNFYPVVCVYEDGGFVMDGYHSNGDPFYSEMANYNVYIQYADTYKIASTGNSVYSADKNGLITDKIEAKTVRDFAMVFCDKWQVVTGKCDDVEITYMYYIDDDAEDTLQTIIDAMTTFNNLLGKYPYSSFTSVQADFVHGGMEYPNLVYISDTLSTRADIRQVNVHELGHQWFYNIVGNDEVKEAWLDESLTEYITSMFFELNSDYGVDYQSIIANYINSYQLFVDVYTDVFGSVDTSMNRSISAFTSDPEYTYLVYVKGVLMLDCIRKLTGDSSFCYALKTYYENNKFGIATSDSFISAFSKATSKDLSGIINSWLEGNVVI